ncbi:MAG: aspartate ammonia-lyase, partial [Thermodesulfobacteriota bacterium]
MKYRTETDSLGPRQVPAGAYWGVQTVRALENFQITGIPVSHFPRLVQALAAVKKAATLANLELDLLDPVLGQAILAACDEVRAGRHDDQFVVDCIQGGAGTSTNMNANEVIANRALELLGRPRGDYATLHPLNHVNLSQSTNDVYPTALRISLVWYSRDLAHSLRELRQALDAKAEEFASVLKMGRTQLQDAVPMTLGQEFAAWSHTLGEDTDRIAEITRLLCEVNLGATAIGTGINTVPGYARRACELLAELTGLPVVLSENLIEATSDTGAYVTLSGMLKRVAVKLSKICNDLRLLSSGPHTGFHEINLPAVQPGSSIMPGKVNPVIPEVVNQVCQQVIGNDLSVTLAAEAGQLELNVFVPLIGFNLLQSLDILSRAAATLRQRCIAGISANRDRCLQLLKSSAGVLTVLAPVIGYEAAAALVKKAQANCIPLEDLAADLGILSREEFSALL